MGNSAPLAIRRLEDDQGQTHWARRLGRRPTLYQLWNETDMLFASPETFETTAQAQACAEKLRKRFSVQGFYLTTAGVRIPPQDVKLVVVPAEE